MRFAKATADDLRQLIRYIDATDPLAESVEIDLMTWIRSDSAGHMDTYATVGEMIDHFTDLARTPKIPRIPKT